METVEKKSAATKSQAEVERWEDQTLSKVLNKRPERKSSFEGVASNRSNGFIPKPIPKTLAKSDFPANFRTNAEFIRPVIAENYGRCASLPDFRHRRKRTHVSNI